MTILPPGVAHDGHPAPGASGFRKRELYLDTVFLPAGLTGAAATLDRSIPHLVRSFTRQFGLSPHAYVTGRRIAAARRLMLRDAAPADVATAVGFYDQAHFTRHFKRHTAITPASFARSHARQAV